MRNGPRAASGVLLLLAAGIVEAQPPLLHLTSQVPASFSGRVGSLGDLDADGCPDFFIAGGTYSLPSYLHVAMTTVYSGRTGSPITAFPGGNTERAGDVDGDGKPDLICRGQGFELRRGFDGGLIHVFTPSEPVPNCECDTLFNDYKGVGDVNGDGRDDQVVLYQLRITQSSYYDVLEVLSGAGGSLGVIEIGWEVGWKEAVLGGGIGDLDHDGRADFAYWSDSAPATIVSGATFATLATVAAPSPNHVVGSSLAGPDLDADGVREILLIGMVPYGGPAFVSVHNVVTQLVVHEFNPAAGFVIGWHSSAGDAGDMNGDGTPDLYLRDVQAGGGRGEVRFYSGSDFSLLATRVGNAPGDHFGSSVSALGDLNGDGLGEVLVAASRCATQLPSSGNCPTFGYADVVTLATLPAAQVTLAGHGCGTGELVPTITVFLPVVYAPLTALVSQAPPGTSGILAAAPGAAAATSLAPGCMLWVPYVPGFVLVPFMTDASGTWSFDAGIPGAGMAGGLLTVQAGVIDPLTQALLLTPGYEVTLGY